MGILRHHDITDPVKPKQEKIEKKQIQKKIPSKNKDECLEVECVGIAHLSQSEKEKISKVWNDATLKRVNNENQRDLVKHFISSIIDDRLDKFDKTTKRLQRQFEQKDNPQNLNRNNPQNIPPPLTEEVSKEDITKNSAPRSLWQ